MKPLPRYAEIRRALEAEILSGAWPPGHRIPSEHALAESYACARMTVNKALAALAEAGLIVRRRRAGSYVAQPATQQPVLEINDIEAEIRALGQGYAYRLLSREIRTADAEDRARLRLDAPGPVLALACLHANALRPMVHEDRLVSLAAVPAAAGQDFGMRAPGGWLLAQIPWTDAEHRIRAAHAAPSVRDALAIAATAACLVVERITWLSGAAVTQVVLTHPGDTHELVARFSPGTVPGRAPVTP